MKFDVVACHGSCSFLFGCANLYDVIAEKSKQFGCHAKTFFMKKHTVILLLVTLAAGAAAVWRFNTTPPAPKAAELLADSTVLLVKLPDITRTREQFPKTAAHALCREPQMQALLQDMQGALMQYLGAPKQSDRTQFSPISVFDPARGEVFFAVAECTFTPRLHLKPVLGMDVRRYFLLTKLALRWREFRIRSWNPNARFATRQHCGISYRVWELNPETHIHFVFLNSLLVYTLDEDVLRDLVERFTHRAPGDFMPLAVSSKYRNAIAQLDTAPELLVYFNPATLHNAWPISLWSSHAESIALSTTFLDTQIRDLRYTLYRAPKHKPTPLARFQTMLLTSPQTTFYRVGTMNLETDYRELLDTIATSGDRALMSQFTQFERLLRRNGIRPDEDLFRHLGPETALLVNWRNAARAPDIALVVELRNLDQLRLRLDVAMTALKENFLTAHAAAPWDVTQFHGETLRTVRFQTSVIAPTYFTTDDFLVIASSPDYARELVSQIKELVPSLAMNADYQQAMKLIPTNAFTHTYCDLRALVPPLLTSVRAGLQREPTQFFDTKKIPATETITKHLAPLVSVAMTDGHNTSTVTISPLGKPITMALGAFAAYYSLRPYFAATPAASTVSSNTAARLPPRENRKATSPAPPTR
jgi:hypothetical protein